MDETTPETTTHSHRKLWALIAAIAVVALIIGGVVVYRQVTHSRALADCTNATSAHQSAIKQLDKTKATATKQVKDTPAGDVSDAKVIQAVTTATEGDTSKDKTKAKQAKDSKQTIPSCPTDAGARTLSDNAATIRQATDKAKKDDKAITTASAALTADVKKTVKAHLDKAIGEGDQLLAGTDGQVADNATRDALKTALDQARTVQGNTKATPRQHQGNTGRAA